MTDSAAKTSSDFFGQISADELELLVSDPDINILKHKIFIDYFH
jgi:hypothetical protein